MTSEQQGDPRLRSVLRADAVSWLTLHTTDLPPNTRWLAPAELAVYRALRIEKRRSEWLLGRFATKEALRLTGHLPDSMERLAILARPDGSPEAFVDGHRLPLHLSISHREGLAMCTISPRVRVGCDVERLEPRSTAMIGDFFTESEVDAVLKAPETRRNLAANVIWSAKESALKLLRTGLRRDTRSVEVAQLDASEPTADGWHTMAIHDLETGVPMEGRWRPEGRYVLTMAIEEMAARPSSTSSDLSERAGHQ